MKRSMTDQQLIEIIAQSRAWRYTQLLTEIAIQTKCSEATAQRMLKRGLTLGFIEKRRGTYQLRDRDAPPTEYRYHTLDRLAMLRIIGERRAWAYTELFDELTKRLGVARSSARTSFRYGRDFGYIHRVAQGWALTLSAREQLERYGQLEGAEGFRFATYLSGQPKRGFRRWDPPPTAAEGPPSVTSPPSVL
jgi:predicted transcriptional regulator